MKIAIESSVLARVNKTGVDHYAQELFSALVPLMPNDEFWLCYLKFMGRPEAKFSVAGPNVKIRRVSWLPGKIYNLFERYLIAIPYDWVTWLKADVYIYPNFIYWPLMFTKKSIVFVHDLGFHDVPQTLVPRHQKYLAKFVPYSLRKATHVATISEHTKKRLIEVYGIDPRKVTVIVPALDHQEFRPRSKVEVAAAAKKYHISGKYILYLGTVEPRKNIVGLLKAYNALPNELKAEYRLVLAGGKGWLDEEINEWCDKLGDRVVRTGYVDQADKAALLTGAQLLAWATLYEGWGIPVLEGMACGTPVITATNSSLPEAAGDAGLLVDAADTNAITDAMTRVLTDHKLAQGMVERGFIQVKKFQWEDSAKKLKEVIEKVGQQVPRK